MRLKHFNIDLGCRVFLSCSDPSRLRLLNLILQNGKMCIRDLEHILSFTQTKTSRHLIYLKNANILYALRYRQWVFYQIKAEIAEIIEQFLQFVSYDAILKKDQQTYLDMHANGELVINQPGFDPPKDINFTH